MDKTTVSNAQELFAWAKGEHTDSFFALLEKAFGIHCNFISMPLDERLRVAMDAERLCEQWGARMAQPSQQDAENFIRSCLNNLDQSAPSESPPAIGKVERNNSDFWGKVAGEPASTRSDRTKNWELQLCTEGDAVYREADKQHVISAGSLVLVPPGVSCSYFRSRSWHHYWWILDIQPHWRSWCSLLQKNDSLTVLQISPEDTRRIAQLIQSCIDYTYPKTAEWFNRSLYNNIESLLIEIQALQPDKPAPLDKRVQNALSFIQNNYRTDWGITELTAHSHISPGRLSVLFKESLGLSPMSMRDSLRMNDACELLINSQKSIRQIGEELGYKDPMHFSRRFSELVGQSPRKYRTTHHRASRLDIDFPST
mgnify:CR=1 FL=1